MTKPKTKSKKAAAVPASIVWFEIPADDLKRARTFYSKLLGWKIKKFPGLKMEYWHIDTGGADASTALTWCAVNAIKRKREDGDEQRNGEAE